MRFKGFFALALACVIVPSTASAAFIAIDDTDPNTITITAGDFEGGLSINSVLFTIGLGNSATDTLPDGGYTISGSWVDLGLTDGRVDILFALSGDPTAVTSGIELAGSTDGTFGTLTGTFGGFFNFTYYFTGLTTALQDGHTENGGFPFLSISFTSEPVAAVPEPASMLLLGSVIPFGFAFRRKKAA